MRSSRDRSPLVAAGATGYALHPVRIRRRAAASGCLPAPASGLAPAITPLSLISRPPARRMPLVSTGSAWFRACHVGLPYACVMSAEREELARLVQELPEQEVPRALRELRKHLSVQRPWPPAWFGIAPGDGTHAGARSEELLAEGFGK